MLVGMNAETELSTFPVLDGDLLYSVTLFNGCISCIVNKGTFCG